MGNEACMSPQPETTDIYVPKETTPSLIKKISKSKKSISTSSIDSSIVSKSQLNINNYIQIPSLLSKWFPQKNAHKDISRTFYCLGNIGESSTSNVMKGIYRNKPVCIKKIERNTSGTILFVSEVRALRKLKKNIGILSIIDYLMDLKYYYIILDLCDFDLYTAINRVERFNMSQVQVIIYKLLEALVYMHSKSIGHRDIKPENILFKNSDLNQPIICDFGDCEFIRDNKIYSEFVGTAPYMSNERLGQYYGWEIKKSDIFSIGCITFELLFCERLFLGDNNTDILNNIMKKKYNFRYSKLPKTVWNFIKGCIHPDSSKRFSAEQALNHKFLRYAKNMFKNGAVTTRTDIELYDSDYQPFNIAPISNPNTKKKKSNGVLNSKHSNTQITNTKHDSLRIFEEHKRRRCSDTPTENLTSFHSENFLHESKREDTQMFLSPKKY